jgi:hypothetical protein
MNEDQKCQAPPVSGLPFIIQHSAISILFTLLCYFAAGPTLGLFIGGFFVAAFFAPVDWKTVAAGVALIWLIPLFQTADTFYEWLRLAALLICFAAAIASINFFLKSIGVHPTFSAAIATLLALAWLTWPIWLSPQIPDLSDNLINNLVALHPPLVANGVLHAEAPWTERIIAYRLTRLNQDTPIHLPTRIWPSAALHLTIAALFFALGCGIRRFLIRTPVGD